MDDLVWDTPRGDLIVWVKTHAAKLNASNEEVEAFTHNPAIPLSLQVATVENLERLGNVPERADVISLMSGTRAKSKSTRGRTRPRWTTR